MYILAVAWEDGIWHHIRSYAPERAKRATTVRLWNKIRTEEDGRWTRAYHEPDPARKMFGAEVAVHMSDGSSIRESLENPDAHYLGARPFGRRDYVGKLRTLCEDMVEPGEQQRFVELVELLPELEPHQVATLNLEAMPEKLLDGVSDRVGLF
jgi:2-methylcitrate dehydratase